MQRKKLSLTYASEWKDKSKFIEIQYNDFINQLLTSKKKMMMSEKIDGSLACLVYEKGKDPFLLSKGSLFLDRPYPLIKEYKEILDNDPNIQSAVIVGELKALKPNGQHIELNRSQSILQTGDVNLIHHFIFDIYKLNGKSNRTDFENLEKLFKNTNHINIPRWTYGGINEFQNLWDIVVNKYHGEGIVAYSLDDPNKLYRIKNILTADLAIIAAGNINEKNWKKGKIGYLRSAILDENNNFLVSSKIGTGFDSKISMELFDYVNKNELYEKDGDIYIPPGLIIEVKYRRHRFIKVPLYHYSNGRYMMIGEKNGIMTIQPSFTRFRDDKQLIHKDLSIDQFPLNS